MRWALWGRATGSVMDHFVSIGVMRSKSAKKLRCVVLHCNVAMRRRNKGVRTHRDLVTVALALGLAVFAPVPALTRPIVTAATRHGVLDSFSALRWLAGDKAGCARTRSRALSQI